MVGAVTVLVIVDCQNRVSALISCLELSVLVVELNFISKRWHIPAKSGSPLSSIPGTGTLKKTAQVSSLLGRLTSDRLLI